MLLIDVLEHYREENKYLLHEFVVMPNHFRLLITPLESIERALQLIKGEYSFRARREIAAPREIWQTSFYDRRVRDAEELSRIRCYIRRNPARRGLTASPEDWPYGSACGRFAVDEVPQWLKPHDEQLLTQA